MTDLLPLLPVIIGAGLFAGSLALLFTSAGRDARALHKRARLVLEPARPADNASAASADPAAAARRARRAEARQPRSLGGRLAALLPDPTFLRTRIARTGYQMSPWSVVASALALTVAVAAALHVLVAQPPMIAVPAGIVLGLGMPYLALGFLAKRRLNKFLNMMPESIDIIVRGVSSGLPVTEAMATVGREMADPIGIEFRRIMDGYRLGRPLGYALAETARRLGLPEFNFLVVAMSIQQETGGNLAETLSNLADIIRKRRQMRLKVKALTGEAKASAMVVGSLPFLLFVVINFMNPGYTDIFFSDPRGHMMLGAGLIAMALGLLIMNKIANFDI